MEAITKKGLFKGLFLGVKRIFKCHPFSNKSGFDPVK
jgi:putative component of membrane protein insertase Oxa1/YidC/SpoIIIJ protein YidD